ncbi:Hydantoinase B/oxoprolinase-domain-containing protein [Ustulina deusta]|nr:Hydantoinase B/oxoprolinase-domain-containing protein [Ustulina deusta]
MAYSWSDPRLVALIRALSCFGGQDIGNVGQAFELGNGTYCSIEGGEGTNLARARHYDPQTHFEDSNSGEFGFVFLEKRVLIDDFYIRAIGSMNYYVGISHYQQLQKFADRKIAIPVPETTMDTCSNAVLILDNTQAILIAPGSIESLLESIIATDLADKSDKETPVFLLLRDELEVNPIKLSISGHWTLQKTSVFPNIKERLDSSCTMFSPDGGLVSDAACVPVHLGSTQFCVKHMHKRKGKLEEGNVLLNAARPSLAAQGAAILGEKLVEKGRFNKERIVELLLHGPAKYPGVSGTRTSSDNLSDLKAQVATNEKGTDLIQAFIQGQLLRKPTSTYLQSSRTRNKLWAALRAVEYMDDGTPIDLPISIDGETGSAVFNFTSTDSQVYANTNAPVAITHSAIVCYHRALIAAEIPWDTIRP